MKRFLLLMVSMALIASSAMAVVGGPEAPEDGAAITSSPSASGSVTENGTEWSSSISNMNSSCMDSNASTGVDLGDFVEENGSHTIGYSGALSTANPCVTIETETTQLDDDTYQVSLEDVSGDEVCVECVGIRNIEGSFTAEGEYSLEIVRDNETIAEAQTPGYQETEPQRSLWDRFIAFLGL